MVGKTLISAITEGTPENRSRQWKMGMHAILTVMVAMILSLILMATTGNILSLPPARLCSVAMDTLGLAVLIMLFSGCMNSHADRATGIFMLIMVANALFLYLDALCWIADGKQNMRVLLINSNTCYYLTVVAQAWLYWQFLLQLFADIPKTLKKINLAVNVLTVADVLLIIGNIAGEYIFYVDRSGVYHRSDAYFVSMICPTAVLVVCIITILQQKYSLREKLVLIAYPAVPYISALLTLIEEEAAVFNVLAFCSVVFVFCNLYISRDRELSRKQTELAQSEVNAMVLQINPHFIYNTLGSAASLCADDPEKAREMLYSFSAYLRNNFSEISRLPMIPFRKEMEHLNSYIAIEKMRFPDIQVETDIRVYDFDIPTLSVQPLVENAITHGIMGRESGGRLRIISTEDARYFHIYVEDDGVGFEEKPKNDGRNHIGIANVRKRLNMLCGGKLIINSTLGVGTVAEIRIPKKEN